MTGNNRRLILKGCGDVPIQTKKGNNHDDIEEFKTNMIDEFEMTDLGLLHYFLGIEDDDSEFVDPTLYRSLVGSLMYLTATRLDIIFDDSLISTFIEKPKKTHWVAEKRILRYVCGTVGDGLYYQKENDSKVLGYCDSDLYESVDDSKSTSRNVLFVGSCVITWMSKKQQVVALSLAEAEYISLSLASCEALWITWVLDDLNHAAKECPIIYYDRKSASTHGKYGISWEEQAHKNQISFYQRLGEERRSCDST
ncbi:secreted RxLR effector protein 161-like [Apium graveolens]|uniref:secreted RxLR effector protein 161-like n=1 Tax=Apium graveolens TaxID=4045 RepID=UPI003D7B4499